MPDPRPAARVLDVRSPAEWEAWLDAHHGTTGGGVWLRLWHKARPESTLDYDAAVDAALCYGWVDGQVKRHDGVSRLLRFTPRRARSLWSRINVERVERLEAEGRMRPAGRAEVDRAKADGRWERAYDPPSRAEPPADFLAALAERPKARAFFETLSRSQAFPVSFRLQTASSPEVRARRMAVLLDRLEQGRPPA